MTPGNRGWRKKPLTTSIRTKRYAVTGNPNRIQLPGTLDFGHSFLRASLAYQPQSKPRVSVFVVRFQGEGAPVFLFRFCQVPFFLQDKGQRDVGFDEIRVEGQRLSSKADDLRPRCFRGTPEKTVPRPL
jgi:hypothetical protein